MRQKARSKWFVIIMISILPLLIIGKFGCQLYWLQIRPMPYLEAVNEFTELSGIKLEPVIKTGTAYYNSSNEHRGIFLRFFIAREKTGQLLTSLGIKKENYQYVNSDNSSLHYIYNICYELQNSSLAPNNKNWWPLPKVDQINFCGKIQKPTYAISFLAFENIRDIEIFLSFYKTTNEYLYLSPHSILDHSVYFRNASQEPPEDIQDGIIEWND